MVKEIVEKFKGMGEMMMKKGLGVVALFLLCFSSFSLLSMARTGNGEQDTDKEQYAENENIMPSENIVIPTVNDVRKNGYPKNELGETYGPAVKGSTEEPDLLLACNELGQTGYVRQSDFDDGVKTLEDAINHKLRRYTVNMYLQDGSTVIGTFTVGN